LGHKLCHAALPDGFKLLISLQRAKKIRLSVHIDCLMKVSRIFEEKDALRSASTCKRTKNVPFSQRDSTRVSDFLSNSNKHNKEMRLKTSNAEVYIQAFFF